MKKTIALAPARKVDSQQQKGHLHGNVKTSLAQFLNLSNTRRNPSTEVIQQITAKTSSKTSKVSRTLRDLMISKEAVMPYKKILKFFLRRCTAGTITQASL